MTKNIFTADHKGFSLLEMSCVLIVMSILASCVIPVLTRSFLEKAGEKVSLDMSAIQEGARAYFIANGGWPASISVLETGQYLPSTWNAINPFGNPYATSINGSVFSVTTQVTNGTQTAIISRLPVSSSTGTTVTSSIPPPGASTIGWGPPAAITSGQSYLASSDGFVVATAKAGFIGAISILTDGNNPPTTIMVSSETNDPQNNSQQVSVSCPIRKGNYYQINAPYTGVFAYFISLGV